MKTLYVLRHGQAEPESERVTDHQRALTRRGRAEVERTAAAVAERAVLPSLVLTSSAARAQQTAELCALAWPARPELVIVDELYLAEPDAYATAVQEHAGRHDAVMVVGHNPGLEVLIHAMTERSEHLATATVVEIHLPLASFAELSLARRAQGRLVFAFRP